MKWSIDVLIVAFIVENILILILGINGLIEGNWWLLILFPLVIWIFSLFQENLLNSRKKNEVKE